MATGTNIHTYFEKNWHKGNIPIMNAADHGSWLGSTVFDGARYFDGVAPDLLAHCERLNQSAKAMGLVPTYSEKEIYDLILEGLANYTKQSAVYIRPMYWGIGNRYSAIVPDGANIGFCICLEEIPMASDANTTTLTRTSFHRPILTDNLCNAKAGCLYPNNARMLQEASTKGFNNALVADAVGNVAETATSNVFLVKDGEIFTPIPNGTFLAGITRSRHIQNLKSDGYQVNECVLKFEDFSRADEVFLTGNMTKITPVSLFVDIKYEIGPVTKRARSLYFDWANSN
jgi:branched-chain amino acid aminotransferase